MPCAVRPNDDDARTVCMDYVRLLLSFLRDKGVDPGTLYRAQDLARFDSQNPLARCTVREWRELMSVAQTRLGQTDLVPALAKHFQPWHVGVVGFTLMTSSSVLELGRSLERFHHLLNDAHEVETALETGRFILRLWPVTAERSDRLARLSLTAWVSVMRWLTGRQDLCFDGNFSGPPPQDVAHYKRIFGGVVRFDQSENSMAGVDGYLSLPIVSQNPAINRVLHEQAVEQLDRLTQGADPLVSQMERLLKVGLDSGEASLESLAAELKLPARTRQRRLDGLGLNFRMVVERVRKVQAMSYLRETKLPLLEISMALGFANPGTFHRAFKRWTGQSPGEFRREHLTRRGEILAAGPAAEVLY